MLCLCFATLLTTFSLPLCHSKVIDNFFTATLPLKSYPVLCFLCLNSSLVCRTNTGAHSSRAAATHSTLPSIDPVDRENLKRRTHRVPLRVSPGGGVSRVGGWGKQTGCDSLSAHRRLFPEGKMMLCLLCHCLDNFFCHSATQKLPSPLFPLSQFLSCLSYKYRSPLQYCLFERTIRAECVVPN